MAKASTKIVSTNRAVKTSCKNTKVRTASGACATERKPMMKSGGTSPFGILSIIAGIDNNPKPTAADRISGAKMKNKKMAKGGTAHPGFKSVQSSIAAKQGISKQAAGAILAASTRKASAKAKAANPRLKKVK
jgi:hypothetical protein